MLSFNYVFLHEFMCSLWCLYLFTNTGVQYYDICYIRWWTRFLKVTRRASHMAQELLFILAFSGVRVARSLVFSAILCSSFFVIFVSFSLIFVLSFLRFTGFRLPLCYLQTFPYDSRGPPRFNLSENFNIFFQHI